MLDGCCWTKSDPVEIVPKRGKGEEERGGGGGREGEGEEGGKYNREGVGERETKSK